MNHSAPSPAQVAPESRPALRRALRKSRTALGMGRRLNLSRRLSAYIARQDWLRPGAAIGLYAHMGSEVATDELRALALRRGCRLYLPRIINYRTYVMVFSHDRGRRLRPSRIGINEPPAGLDLDVRRLDVVLMPLVGFDSAGNRLGNGAGYYDRLLAGTGASGTRPLLVGLGFECQRLAQLTTAPHDIPLDAVVSERGVQFFRERSYRA